MNSFVRKEIEANSTFRLEKTKSTTIIYRNSYKFGYMVEGGFDASFLHLAKDVQSDFMKHYCRYGNLQNPNKKFAVNLYDKLNIPFPTDRRLFNARCLDEPKFYDFNHSDYLLSDVLTDGDKLLFSCYKNHNSNETCLPNFIKEVKTYHDFWGFKIDISSAYWSTAHGLFLSDSVYNWGKTLKSKRLMALGSLASKKNIQLYDRGNLIYDTFVHKVSEPYYREIQRLVGEVMERTMLYVCEAVGFWVDCIFLRTDDNYAKEEIIRIFKDFGYDCKTQSVKMNFVKTVYENRINVSLVAENKTYHVIEKYL